nr:biotin/lipoate--protein ligase family protein [Pseudoruegeria sp. HB172150]
MQGEAVSSDPFAAACARAAEGCDAGLVLYRIGADALAAALVFAPEVPLADAVAMLPVCGIGFQNALGALAPPEVAVHLDWDGGIRVNGGLCGRLRMVASSDEPEAVPDWLIVGLEVTLIDPSERPGDARDRTALYAEGCGEVSPELLVEAWARHTLVWIGRWEDDGMKPVHDEWSGLAYRMGEPVQVCGRDGTFVGVDERLGMLMRENDETILLPLTDLLEERG